jgi:hypothetical protein
MPEKCNCTASWNCEHLAFGPEEVTDCDPEFSSDSSIRCPRTAPHAVFDVVGRFFEPCHPYSSQPVLTPLFLRYGANKVFSLACSCFVYGLVRILLLIG